MNNRWGKQLQTKGSLRSSGQNNINININFNALKDKANVFGGKKIDNFIEISNQPKQTITRPNVSMQTLKQKKKKLNNKQEIYIQQEIKRKKSKSKITNDICTPEKIYKERQSGNSKSIGKKSTKKRSAKSYDNLKKFYDRNSSRQVSKQGQKSKSSSQEQSKSNSKSRSKSRSQSNKKMIKVSSKNKIPTNSTNTRAKNSSHNSKNNKIQQTNPFQKTKKIPVKKTQKQKIIQLPSQQTPVQTITRKASADRLNRKKSVQQDIKKSNKTKTPRKKSKQKQSKSLKRLPLFYQQQQNQYDQQSSYQKMQKQAHRLLYEQQQSQLQQNKKIKKQKKEIKKKQTSYIKYLQNIHTYQDIIKLTQAAKKIQKIWRGYKVRIQFINQLNMLNHKIQITKNKIANQDPKFWDDAQSNSILNAQDAQSINSQKLQQQQLSQLHSDIQKPISQQSSNYRNNKNQMTKNRIIQYSEHQEMLERISKLQQILKKQQQKAQQLQQQNKQLKVNLQKISVQSGQNSQVQSMQSSVRQGHQWSLTKPKHEFDPFIEQQSNKKQKKHEQESQQQFQLRLPKKIANNINKKQQNKKQQIRESLAQQQNKDNKLNKYKNRMESYQCSSPKYQVAQVSIDKGLVDLFKKKQDQLKQTYEKKITMFDRMLSESVFSPRTIKTKKTEIQQKFRQETEAIRRNVDLITLAVGVIQQLKGEQGLLPNISKPKQQPKQQNKQQIKPTAIIKNQNHIIQDYGNINLNSHRSKSQSQQNDQFQSSQESQKSSNPSSIFKKIQQSVIKQIDSKNDQAIKIFNEVAEFQNQKQQYGQQKMHSQQPPRLDNNSSQVFRSQSQVSQKSQKKKFRGLQTTLLFIKQYCVSFVEFIRSSQQHKNSFIQGICSPIVYDSFQFLKSYRTTMTHQNDTSYYSQEKQYIYPYFKLIYPKSQVITREAFNQFNEIYDKLKGQCEFLAQRQFFLNSLLDAFNESLDYKRPCSIYGEPPKWISQSRALKNYNLINQSNLLDRQSFLKSQKFDEICGVAIARVIEWSTSLCGFIPESPEMENVVIEQQQINHIRETRIALMLEKDLLENEENILDFVIEQTEVKLQMSQCIVTDLLEEFVKENIKFFK